MHELTEAWANGDAVLPVDPRLPIPAVWTLLDAMRPFALVDEGGEHQLLPDPISTEAGDALVVATSGTTGEPKGVVLTHDAVSASARATSARIHVDPSADAWLALLPVAHIGGLSVITRALITGTPLLFGDTEPDSERPATLVSIVPTQANRLDLGRFRVVLVGGSSDWRDRPPNVVRTYGLTETGSGIAYDGVALEGAAIRIDDKGEIHVRGPMLLRTYRDGTDPKNRDGWLATGDSGQWLEDGRLRVDGRIAEVIVTGGEKVWPTAVEDAIRTHHAIDDVAVAGLPDDDWGQRVVAWVVPSPHVDEPSLTELREHVKATLPRHYAPRQIVVVEGVARTALGKVRRKLLPDPR